MTDLFRGVCPVVNTPFLENGDLDLESLGKIVDYTVAAGCKSIAIFGLNSEPHKMIYREKEAVIKAFLGSVGKRAYKLVGIVENSLRGATELATIALKAGADGLILYPPSLVPPGDSQLLNYFKTIASAVSCPVMIQDAPRTTGVTMSTPFLLNAFEKIENFKFAKIECSLPVQKIAEIVRETKQQLKCLSGNGGIFTIDAFMRGAWGVMPGIGVIEYFVKLYECLAAGDENRSRDIFENLMPLLWFEDQSLEFFIACEKEILKQKDVIRSSLVREPRFVMDKYTLDELNMLLMRLKPVHLSG